MSLLAMTEVKIGLVALLVLLLVAIVIIWKGKGGKRHDDIHEVSNSISHTYDHGKVITAGFEEELYQESYSAQNPYNQEGYAEHDPFEMDQMEPVSFNPMENSIADPFPPVGEETIQPYGTDSEETIQPYSDTDSEETIQPYSEDDEETINPYDNDEETLPPAWEPPAVVRFVVDTKEEDPYEREISFADNMIIGRKQDCELCLAPMYISRMHIELTKTPDGIFIRNLNPEKSSRYTLLNRTELNEEERKLEDGDVLEISKTRIEFHIVNE